MGQHISVKPLAEDPVLEQQLYILGMLRESGPEALAAGRVLAYYNIVRVVEKRLLAVIAHGQVSVRVRAARPAADITDVTADTLLHVGSFFAAYLREQSFELLTDLFVVEEQRFERGSNIYLLYRIYAALGFEVKHGYAVHVVAPQLYSYRHTEVHGVNVEYRATERELRNTLYLITARIARFDQSGRDTGK